MPRMLKKASAEAVPRKPLKQRIIKDIRKNYLLYLLLIPGIITLVLFKLGPLGGMVIAFEDFSAFQGAFGSKWVGLENFKRILQDPYMITLVKNTVILAVLSIVVVFPIPVLFSLFLNEVRQARIKNSVQTLSFLPYFISSAVMVSILYTLVSPSYGLINNIIKFFGGTPIYFMAEPEWFRPLYIGSTIWQTMGFNAIVYIAALVGISPDYYEAATLDGASVFQKIKYIELPLISPTIILMLILTIGNIMNVGYEKAYLMQNGTNTTVSELISTYVYKVGLQSAQYSFATAVGLFNSVVNFIILIIANQVAKRVSDISIF